LPAPDATHGEAGARLAVRSTESYEGRDLAGRVEVRDRLLGIDRHGMAAVPQLRAVEYLTLGVDTKAAGWRMPDYVELDRIERRGGDRAERGRLTEVSVLAGFRVLVVIPHRRHHVRYVDTDLLRQLVDGVRPGDAVRVQGPAVQGIGRLDLAGWPLHRRRAVGVRQRPDVLGVRQAEEGVDERLFGVLGRRQAGDIAHEARIAVCSRGLVDIPAAI